MASLPIPAFDEVTEIREPAPWVRVLIAPDRHAGSSERYTVIRIDLTKGTASCIGREVDLGLARDLAEGRR